MSHQVAIYLAGSIQKGHEKNDDSYWTEADRLFLGEKLAPYKVSFLNPALRSDDLSDQRSVFGRDMLQVFCSDFIFVDARHKRGLGVGAEMMWAKVHGRPILTLAPKESHYHKSETSLLGVAVKEWVHPFVESLSDAIVENLEEGARWIRHFLSHPRPVKGMSEIESAMRHYLESQLNTDQPMQQLLAESHTLENRIQTIHENRDSRDARRDSRERPLPLQT